MLQSYTTRVVCCVSDGPRPSKEEIKHLRAYMLLYVKEIVMRGQGVQDDEIQALINFLTTVHEVNVTEVKLTTDTVKYCLLFAVRILLDTQWS